LRADLFDYELPEALIAQRPAPTRDGGRLLIVAPGGVEHRRVADWSELVAPGALVVVNDSKVLRARLLGRRRDSGGKVELLLVRLLARLGPERERWEAVGRASNPIRPGLVVEAGTLVAQVAGRHADGTLEIVVQAPGGIEAALERSGRVPLPPYVRRADDADDVARYQTVYARAPGSVAAPTAGLHLAPATLERLRARDVVLGAVTLHVGLGTFRPIATETLQEHPMHAEELEVSPELCRQVADARRRGAPVVAVGTTSVRALETAADAERPGEIRPLSGETRLFIRPGYAFRVVDALLSNFHAPRSTLLALVAAFAGRRRVLAAYAEAVRAGYRFLSYGDACWFPERLAEPP
jgi:S-adenosylmethionine:tRNA ribosyltransferase-isomerase